jgi:DNA-binding XRE family transcriptional regulator
LHALRSICAALGLDILTLFGIECHFCAGNCPDADLFRLGRNELISRRREAVGLTREQLGDRIGFETTAIEEMERDPAFLEQWSVELILELAKELRIPEHALLRAPCSKCGKGAEADRGDDEGSRSGGGQ